MRLAAAIALAIVTGVHSAASVAAPPPPPGTTVPPPPATPWNAGTAEPPPPAAGDDTSLSLRIYEQGRASPLPYRPRPTDDPAYAVDVSAIMGRCPDGRLVITALLIGGHLTPLDNRCSTEPGRVRSAPAAECDANTWSCATAPPQ